MAVAVPRVEDARLRPGQAGFRKEDAAPIPVDGASSAVDERAVKANAESGVRSHSLRPARIGGGARSCPRASLDRPAERHCHANLALSVHPEDEEHVTKRSTDRARRLTSSAS